MEKQKVIKIKDVFFSYKNKEVLKKINMEIYKNDFAVIIGPNGGGKTTLLKLILGLMKPDLGEIFVLDKSASESSCKIGYVPQQSKFDWKYPINVFESVLSGRMKFKRFPDYFINKRDKEIVFKTLKLLEIFDLKERHISELSGGQRKRVFIARALVTDPDILILDEPTSDIDKKIESDVYELLKKLAKIKTILMVSHDIGIVSRYVNKIICLNKYAYVHSSNKISEKLLTKTYNCPVDMITHGDVPHRVLKNH
jgi:zinc transport system ATP-binding protein